MYCNTLPFGLILESLKMCPRWDKFSNFTIQHIYRGLLTYTVTAKIRSFQTPFPLFSNGQHLVEPPSYLVRYCQHLPSPSFNSDRCTMWTSPNFFFHSAQAPRRPDKVDIFACYTLPVRLSWCPKYPIPKGTHFHLLRAGLSWGFLGRVRVSRVGQVAILGAIDLGGSLNIYISKMLQWQSCMLAPCRIYCMLKHSYQVWSHTMS